MFLVYDISYNFILLLKELGIEKLANILNAK